MVYNSIHVVVMLILDLMKNEKWNKFPSHACTIPLLFGLFGMFGVFGGFY